MANTGLAFLGSLRIQAQQRSDMVNSGFVTTPEWNSYLSRSYKELYDLLLTCYGDDYMVSTTPYSFQTVSNQNLYPLPDGSTTIDTVTGLAAAPFYKMAGLDLKVTSSPNSWVTLRNFMFVERNQFQPVTYFVAPGILGFYYRVMGTSLWLTPVPTGAQSLQMWYAPKPTNLMPEISVGTTSASAVVTTSDTSQLAVGMSVADLVLPQGATQVVPDNTTISSIVANTSFTMSATASATKVGYLLGCWSDSTTFDGISGYEEYVVIDAAMKACLKEESSTFQELMAQKMAIKQRIEETAANRDQGMAQRVSDTGSLNLGYAGGFGFGVGGWDW